MDLYKPLKKGTFLYRVRIHDKKEYLKEVTQLGPPKRDNAYYSNRMSPAGIPMFYGAYDIGTAIKETYCGDITLKVTATFNDSSEMGTVKRQTYLDDIATIAKFKLLKDITLVDLSKIPKIPGFFEEVSYSHHEITFLNDFITDISKGIDKDGCEHIEYVPTQIITEHLRYLHHRKHDNEKIYGIIYPSSKNKGKNSVVVFCENEHCVEKQKANNESFFELESARRCNPKKYTDT